MPYYIQLNPDMTVRAVVETSQPLAETATVMIRPQVNGLETDKLGKVYNPQTGLFTPPPA